jgi:hypothetical protein
MQKFPLILKHQAGRLIKKYIEENKLEYDIICGVPYGAFAVATVIFLFVLPN